MSIGKKIRELCEQKNISLASLGRKLGKTRTAVYAMVENEDVSTAIVRQCAKIFNVPVSYFFDEEEQPAPAKKRKGCGDAILSVAETLAGAPSREELQAKIDHLEEELAAARRQQDINYRYILMLEKQLGIEQPTEKNTITA